MLPLIPSLLDPSRLGQRLLRILLNPTFGLRVHVPNWHRRKHAWIAPQAPLEPRLVIAAIFLLNFRLVVIGPFIHKLEFVAASQAVDHQVFWVVPCDVRLELRRSIVRVAAHDAASAFIVTTAEKAKQVVVHFKFDRYRSCFLHRELKRLQVFLAQLVLVNRDVVDRLTFELVVSRGCRLAVVESLRFFAVCLGLDPLIVVRLADVLDHVRERVGASAAEDAMEQVVGLVENFVSTQCVLAFDFLAADVTHADFVRGMHT